jgi:hypothetical protein
VAPFGFGYTQTGLHLFLKEHKKAMEVGHRNLKQTLDQIRSPAQMATNHTTKTYLQRFEFSEYQPILETSTVENVHQEHAVGEVE